MSDNDESIHEQAVRANRNRCLLTLATIENRHPAIEDSEAAFRAIKAAMNACSSESVASALKDEDAGHINARINLVLAQVEALYVSSEYLMQLAERLRDDAARLFESIERGDDSDL